MLGHAVHKESENPDTEVGTSGAMSNRKRELERRHKEQRRKEFGDLGFR